MLIFGGWVVWSKVLVLSTLQGLYHRADFWSRAGEIIANFAAKKAQQ